MGGRGSSSSAGNAGRNESPAEHEDFYTADNISAVTQLENLTTGENVGIDSPYSYEGQSILLNTKTLIDTVMGQETNQVDISGFSSSYKSALRGAAINLKSDTFSVVETFDLGHINISAKDIPSVTNYMVSAAGKHKQ